MKLLTIIYLPIKYIYLVFLIILPSIAYKKCINTTVNAPVTQVNLGTLTMEEEKSTSFAITNVGHQPLVIYDVVASCGCTTVDYDKKPVSPNKRTTIEVVYTAEEKGVFDKTVTVHCNAAESPLKFKIKGFVK